MSTPTESSGGRRLGGLPGTAWSGKMPGRVLPRRRLKVLVVDDDPALLDALGRLMAHFGHDARTAPTPGDAVATAAGFEPDVVICDLGLTIGSGYDVLRSLRSMSFGERCSIVALTGDPSPRERTRCAAAGFDAHWPKPADPDMMRRFLAARRPGTRTL